MKIFQQCVHTEKLAQQEINDELSKKEKISTKAKSKQSRMKKEIQDQHIELISDAKKHYLKKL